MGRAPCCDKNGLKKGPWTPEEDQKLLDYIQEHGHGRWRTLPKNAGLSRCGKSCRLRWTNYLRPDIKRGRFSFEEEEAIIQLHSILGNKWSAIATQLPGRTDNEIKNFWNTHIRKRLLRMGIDPVTHSPRLDLLDLSSLLNSSLYSTPSQLEVSRLLGIEPVLNTELLRIATSLLSAQRQNTDHLHQNNFQEQQQQQQQQQLIDPKVREHFEPSFSHEQLANPVQQIPVCSNSTSVPLFDGAQLMHTNEGLLHPVDQVNPWQNNSLPCSLPEGFSIPPNSEFYGGAQTMASRLSQLLSEAAPDFDLLRGQDFNLPSVLSTPATSPTPLNSSPTYINGTTTEDERESYCSSVLNYPVADLLDVGVFM